MHPLTSSDLRTALILMIPQIHLDGEGGWRTYWQEGPRLWAALWPLKRGVEANLMALPAPRYRLTVREEITLLPPLKFLWETERSQTYLIARTAPTLIQKNKFQELIVEEEAHA